VWEDDLKTGQSEELPLRGVQAAAAKLERNEAHLQQLMQQTRSLEMMRYRVAEQRSQLAKLEARLTDVQSERNDVAEEMFHLKATLLHMQAELCHRYLT
jgi:hypothetical protein